MSVLLMTILSNHSNMIIAEVVVCLCTNKYYSVQTTVITMVRKKCKNNAHKKSCKIA